MLITLYNYCIKPNARDSLVKAIKAIVNLEKANYIYDNWELILKM